MKFGLCLVLNIETRWNTRQGCIASSTINESVWALTETNLLAIPTGPLMILNRSRCYDNWNTKEVSVVSSMWRPNLDTHKTTLCKESLKHHGSKNIRKNQMIRLEKYMWQNIKEWINSISNVSEDSIDDPTSWTLVARSSWQESSAMWTQYKICWLH